jgi:hypothetical protein
MYEYTICCLVCGSTTSQGGLSQPPQLTDTDVLTLERGVHNPGCPVAALGTGSVSQTPGDEPNVTVYRITPDERTDE